MDIIIRDARDDDISRMAALLANLFSLEEDFSADRQVQETGLRMLLDSDAVMLCAVAGTEVVGMMTMQMVISTAMGGLAGLVEDVVVAEPWRGRGIASRMMAAMDIRCRDAGGLRMQLVADEDNHTAHRFYRQRGWKPTNLRSWMRLPGDDA